MGSISPPATDSNDKVFDLDEEFWNNYAKGRPQPPDSFFERIFNYHREQGGEFGVIHDVGAGAAPYARRLRNEFKHVIISDIAAQNVAHAKHRLGTDGFSFRAAKVEDADDIPPATVDLVFATNMMHWADQYPAMRVIAKQLKPGGTFACAGFGAARFIEDDIEDVWTKMNHQGGRDLIAQSNQQEKTINIMGRTEGKYNVAPIDTDWFEPGAQRIRLNLHRGGVAEMVPPEEAHRNTEPNHLGAHDIEIYEDEEGWYFEVDWKGLEEHMNSFPYLMIGSEKSVQLREEMKSLMKDGRKVRGYWPANIILATRKFPKKETNEM